MDVDTRLFDEIKERSVDRLANYAGRDELFRNMYNMSVGHWDRYDSIQDKGGNIMPIVTPDPSNFVDGLVRLLTPSEPSIVIPKDQDNLDAIQNADDIEGVANAILLNAGRVRGDPVTFDIMHNAVVFSEVHGHVKSWDLERPGEG
jgi:hypothetical protein